MSQASEYAAELKKGGAEKYHERLKASDKLFARDRIELLVDPGSFVEEGLYANCKAKGLPADAVITGFAKVDGRPVAVVANDSTVKAGSCGRRTVEKIIRLQEHCEKMNLPVFYLVDSAGLRITDQVDVFPGRRGFGQVFYLQNQLSGKVPQMCLLFGPSAAGGAYMPSFCDLLVMVEKNSSMYLGSPRMAEKVIGEKVSAEEMGGALMHCSVSGVGDVLVPDEQSGIAALKQYFSYMPQHMNAPHSTQKPQEALTSCDELEKIIPPTENRAFNMLKVIDCIVDKGSFFEMKKEWAKELITGFGRLDGKPIGIVANQSMAKGGVIFIDSADKAARFIQICDAFNIPLLFLSDVPGFMIGSKIEKEGMIRHGAKMVYSVSRASVPKMCLVVRKAYGAGLYAMCGPGFGADHTLALPTAKCAVMGAEPAVNAVYYNKIQELEESERKAFIDEKIKAYNDEIDIYRLASEQVIDQIIDFPQVRSELKSRFEFAETKSISKPQIGIMPM